MVGKGDESGDGGAKSFLLFGSKSEHLKRNVHTSRFLVFFESYQNCMQITATPRRSILHAAKSSQMPYNAKIQNLCIYGGAGT
jgi:hypothetical protein